MTIKTTTFQHVSNQNRYLSYIFPAASPRLRPFGRSGVVSVASGTRPGSVRVGDPPPIALCPLAGGDHNNDTRRCLSSQQTNILIMNFRIPNPLEIKRV